MTGAASPIRPLALLAIAVAVALGGCDSKAPVAPPPAAATPEPAAPVVSSPPAPRVESNAAAPRVVAGPSTPAYGPEPADEPPPQHAVVGDYRPPLAQPRPIAVPWAPPPLLAEALPPQPTPDAVWTGGYWVWRDGWAWAPGHWSVPPRPRYRWVPPYYEHRRDQVVFVDGFWSAPGVAFVPPPPSLAIALVAIGAGFTIGRHPDGPEGPFVPPPPGSRWGLIVPAPPGTSPRVVASAPPIVAVGMRVTNNVNVGRHDTTIVNRNTTINQYTIEAPASATAHHEAVRLAVPAQPVGTSASTTGRAERPLAVVTPPAPAIDRRDARPIDRAPERAIRDEPARIAPQAPTAASRTNAPPEAAMHRGPDATSSRAPAFEVQQRDRPIERPLPPQRERAVAPGNGAVPAHAPASTPARSAPPVERSQPVAIQPKQPGPPKAADRAPHQPPAHEEPTAKKGDVHPAHEGNGHPEGKGQGKGEDRDKHP